MTEENNKQEEVKTLPPEHVEAIAQAIVNAGASNLVPVLVHSLKVAVGAFVDDLALNIKMVDLGAASPVVNVLAGNIASAIKAWVNTLNYPAPRPGPAPYPPQPQPYYPPQPGPQPQPQPYYPQPQPQPAPYYPPQPPQPYYPPQPQPAPQPPQPPRGPEINVR